MAQYFQIFIFKQDSIINSVEDIFKFVLRHYSTKNVLLGLSCDNFFTFLILYFLNLLLIS